MRIAGTSRPALTYQIARRRRGPRHARQQGRFKEDVLNLEEVIVQKGVAHFNNQEAEEEISNYIYEFNEERV
ncbi:putative soluble epoxide hydrolase [Medicago truncatula]|uniref:Putative soluble epoxide hydrolase n=1 Tax=Medicago truncatula TaxID=3880 RepID=A0A396H7M3_MEDTR|nr:putative soluble epoxide hydrolase [Medicago truncatula]